MFLFRSLRTGDRSGLVCRYHATQSRTTGSRAVKPAALAAPVITSQITAKETAVKLAELTKPNTATSITENTAEVKTSPHKFSAVATTDLPTETAVLELSSFGIESPSLAERTREWLITGRNQRIGKALRLVGAIVIALEIAAAVFLYTRWEKKHAAFVQSSRPVAAVNTTATPAVVPPPTALLPEAAVPDRCQTQKTKSGSATARGWL